jgi:hypothetical protein
MVSTKTLIWTMFNEYRTNSVCYGLILWNDYHGQKNGLFFRLFIIFPSGVEMYFSVSIQFSIPCLSINLIFLFSSLPYLIIINDV